MSFLSVNPTDSEYADVVSERMRTSGRDLTDWDAWNKTIRDVLRGNGVTDTNSVDRRMGSIRTELRRRSAVVRKIRAERLAKAES